MTTKTVFARFELAIRHPHPGVKPKHKQRSVNDAWQALNAADRISITDAITAANTAAARVQEQLPIAVNAGNAFTAQFQLAPAFWEAYVKAKNENTFLLTLQTRSHAAWEALEAEYVRLGLDQGVRNYIANQVTAAGQTEWITTTLDMIDDLNDTAFPAPDDANGQPKMLERFLTPRAKRRIREGAALNSAIAEESGLTDLDDQGKWEAWKTIGEGGQGTAWIWLWFDQHNTIQRRVVEKDTDFHNNWFNIKAWHGDDLRDYGTRQPNEHRVQDQLSHVAGSGATSSYTVKTLMRFDASMVDTDWHLHRLYTEWCPLGDLGALIGRYKARPSPNDFIPEPMLWCVAEGLAFAGNAMQYGHQGLSAPKLANWEPIVHRDLKPSNIFLTMRQNNAVWSMYPHPKVGDFGLAIETDATDVHNPSWYLESGTKGFLAPEQQSYVNRDTRQPMNPVQLGEKTNVFGVGLILFNLVTLGRGGNDQPEWLGPNPEDDDTFKLNDVNGNAFPHLQRHNAAKYSDQLRKVIDHCTQYDPGSRPSFREMITQIRALGVADWPGDKPPDNMHFQLQINHARTFLTRGLRSGWAHNIVRDENRLEDPNGLPYVMRDNYRMNLTRAQLAAVVPQQLV